MPIARESSAAVTDESTPPDSPQMTRLFPTFSRMASICRSISEEMVPGSLAAADLVDEVRQQRRAELRVRHFRVELQTVDRPGVVTDRGRRAGVGRGQGDEVFAEVADLVAVAHPRGELGRHTIEERILFLDAADGMSELAGVAGRDLAAEGPADLLHAVADSQDRDAQLEQGRIGMGGAIGVDAGRSTGEDQSPGIDLADSFDRQVVTHELAEDVFVPDAAGDQLGRLRPKVKHQNDFFLAWIDGTEVTRGRLWLFGGHCGSGHDCWGSQTETGPQHRADRKAKNPAVYRTLGKSQLRQSRGYDRA